MVFFWSKDFTFVCPTEIAAFGKLNDEFSDRDAQILGVSIDSEFVHFQWRAQHEDLKRLPFPMLSDIKRELVQATGVLNADGDSAAAESAQALADRLGAKLVELGSVSPDLLVVGSQPNAAARRITLSGQTRTMLNSAGRGSVLVVPSGAPLRL